MTKYKLRLDGDGKPKTKCLKLIKGSSEKIVNMDAKVNSRMIEIIKNLAR